MRLEHELFVNDFNCERIFYDLSKISLVSAAHVQSLGNYKR